MNDKHYHIDVTPEEESMFNTKLQVNKTKIKEPSKVVVTGVIIAAHILCAACVIGVSSSYADQQFAENKNKHETTQPGTKNQDEDKSTETPSSQTAANNSTNKISALPKPIHAAPLVPKVETHPQKPNQNKLVKNYVVKSGDTIYSIAKKYRLVSARLMEINGIKDPKQLRVGQVLKFM